MAYEGIYNEKSQRMHKKKKKKLCLIYDFGFKESPVIQKSISTKKRYTLRSPPSFRKTFPPKKGMP